MQYMPGTMLQVHRSHICAVVQGFSSLLIICAFFLIFTHKQCDAFT